MQISKFAGGADTIINEFEDEQKENPHAYYCISGNDCMGGESDYSYIMPAVFESM
ncbi:MAG: hypothetical protein ACOYIF_04595 [Acetivibrionales bacterium]|jgi:hypothetical protein